MNPISPSIQEGNTKPLGKKVRNSNLELYRIIVMLLIVMHHYVVNSGLFQVIQNGPMTASSTAMLLFGAWGKTGINCFVLITGYFMCKSRFSWQKLLKLYLQITFYAVIIYGIFCITGHESLSIKTIFYKFLPIRGLTDNFVSAFLLFYLCIPFLNILIRHISKRQHILLVIGLIIFYSILPNIPDFYFAFNYIEWFAILYIVASFLRFYTGDLNITHRQWGWLTLFSFIGSSLSVLAMFYAYHYEIVNTFFPYYFIADSNKFLALSTAITSFMWFKDIKMKYYPWINAIGATTFGVLLIHANSDAMRQWLWKETVDCVDNFGNSVIYTLTYAFISCLLIFFICSFIDWLRIKLIELKFNRKIENILILIKPKI